MGLDRTIRYPGEVPSWETICEHLSRLGEVPKLRMIDGLPAFPDETPAAAWKELRVGFIPGMVTLRRAHETLLCVVWGNADDALLAAWERLCWACAEAGRGLVETPERTYTANEFAAAVGLVPA
jgi:hypothetical protein